MSNDIISFAVGDLVRVGKGKAVWTVVRVITPEESSMVRPAGVSIARDTGQHKTMGMHVLGDLHKVS